MDDIDNYIPVSRALLDRIQSLVGDIEVDLDAPLPPEKISEEEYRTALAAGEKLMTLPVTPINRQRMERIVDLIQTYRSELTDFSSHPSDTPSD